MTQRLLFYRRTVSKWIPDRSASILVVAGGTSDRDVFHELGFSAVVISNIDRDARATDVAPYSWSQQNAEALGYRDGEFDYVVVHAGLHHCRSPHRGLLEMYRVAGKAVIAFEPPDNLLVRIMQRIRLAQVYEYTAVRCNEGRCGGADNSDIPNYIYRWTEHEIEQVIGSYAPCTRHRYQYAYDSDEPTREFIAESASKRALVGLAKPAYRLWSWCFPTQQNLFAFMINKPVVPRDLQPWLVMDGKEIRFNPRWDRELR